MKESTIEELTDNINVRIEKECREKYRVSVDLEGMQRIDWCLEELLGKRGSQRLRQISVRYDPPDTPEPVHIKYTNIAGVWKKPGEDNLLILTWQHVEGRNKLLKEGLSLASVSRIVYTYK